MSLRSKTLIVTLSGATVLALIIHGISQAIFMAGFERVEEQNTQEMACGALTNCPEEASDIMVSRLTGCWDGVQYPISPPVLGIHVTR